jgi:hypothetical protein
MIPENTYGVTHNTMRFQILPPPLHECATSKTFHMDLEVQSLK